MKSRKLLSLLLLLALGFSIVHEFAIVLHEEAHGHRDIAHYVKEFSEPVSDTGDKNDLCESHYLFHISFIISAPVNFVVSRQIQSTPKKIPALYPSSIPQKFLKPPIA